MVGHFLALFLLAPLMAAPLPKKPTHLSLLSGEHDQALARLRQAQPDTRLSVGQLAFDNSLDLKSRWRALMIYSQVEGAGSLPLLRQALKSPQWFMRSGALTAVHGFDPAMARAWASPLFQKDPALMVRMKAFEILREKMDGPTVEIFWRKLQSSENFHQRRGLWIREDIVRELARNPRTTDQSRWVQMLHGDEAMMQKFAAQALAKLSGNSDETLNLSSLKQRYPVKAL